MAHPAAELEYEQYMDTQAATIAEFVRWLDGTHPTMKVVLGDKAGWSAILSQDERLRYALKRPVYISGTSPNRMLVSCGQNPSKADAFRNDNTVKKEIGFAERWMLGWYVKVNAYAWRDTHPKDLWAAGKRGQDIVGPRNDEAIRSALGAIKKHGGVALAAWGTDIEPAREARLIILADEVGVQWMCLGKNKGGSPKHSLYPAYSTPLVRWP